MTEENGKKDQGCGCGGGKWIWIGLALAVFAVLLARNPRLCGCAGSVPPEKTAPAADISLQTESTGEVKSAKKLPLLVELGADQCIPCKMMAPILENLKKNYAGKFEVQFIDVWQNPDAGDQREIRMIPTQIFYDAAGRELFRHEGFYGEEDILAKWEELGVELMRNAE